MIEYDISQIAPEGEVEPPEENSGSINDLGVFGSTEMRGIAKQQLTALGINTDVLSDEFTGEVIV